AGETPLMQACMVDNDARAEEIVKILLDHGADVVGADKNGLTALIGAAEKGHSSAAALLLEKGAMVDQANKVRQRCLSSSSTGPAYVHVLVFCPEPEHWHCCLLRNCIQLVEPRC
ncbi:unnamed protein product, partial [Ostreobium quekettii]